MATVAIVPITAAAKTISVPYQPDSPPQRRDGLGADCAASRCRRAASRPPSAVIAGAGG